MKVKKLRELLQLLIANFGAPCGMGVPPSDVSAGHVIKLCEPYYSDKAKGEFVEIIKQTRLKMADKGEKYNQGYADACNDIYKTIKKHYQEVGAGE